MSYTRISIHVVAASHFFRFSSSFILKKKRTLTETRLSFLSSSFYSSFFVWPLCLALESWTNQSNELLLFSLVTFGNAAERIMRYELKKEKRVIKRKTKLHNPYRSQARLRCVAACALLLINPEADLGGTEWGWFPCTNLLRVPFDCRQQQSLRCLFPTQMLDNALIMP